jgi:Cu-Zn family superoxide dismutase
MCGNGCILSIFLITFIVNLGIISLGGKNIFTFIFIRRLMMKKMGTVSQYLIVLACCLTTTAAFADIVVPMHLTTKQGVGKMIGNITIKETNAGLEFMPNLSDLKPGEHGFHVHTNPDCSNMGEAAGGHFDPAKTGHHLGPYKQGQLGDLPVLMVTKDGKATKSVIAPHLKSLNEIKDRSLMVHAGGDNYSDNPPLGGGGARIACGVIK